MRVHIDYCQCEQRRTLFVSLIDLRLNSNKRRAREETQKLSKKSLNRLPRHHKIWRVKYKSNKRIVIKSGQEKSLKCRGKRGKKRKW